MSLLSCLGQVFCHSDEELPNTGYDPIYFHMTIQRGRKGFWLWCRLRAEQSLPCGRQADARDNWEEYLLRL
jgi:hypothetical protein